MPGEDKIQGINPVVPSGKYQNSPDLFLMEIPLSQQGSSISSMQSPCDKAMMAHGARKAQDEWELPRTRAVCDANPGFVHSLRNFKSFYLWC